MCTKQIYLLICNNLLPPECSSRHNLRSISCCPFYRRSGHLSSDQHYRYQCADGRLPQGPQWCQVDKKCDKKKENPNEDFQKNL